MDSKEIITKWDEAKNLDPRKKYSVLKSLCTEIIGNIKNRSVDPDCIDAFIPMLSAASKVSDSSPRYGIAKSQLTVLKLANLGVDVDSVTVLQKKSKIICLESATFGLGDPELIEEKNLEISVDPINEGRRFFFSTGGDGKYKLEVRVLDTPIPVLSSAEYKLLLSSTGVSQIEVKSGYFLAGDACNTDSKKGLVLSLGPGLYNISAFLLGGKSGPTSYVAILGKALEKTQSSVNCVETLEFVG